jgi:hypothetical protein
MEVTKLGILIDDNEEHPWKHSFPMEETEFGTSMESKDEHL